MEQALSGTEPRFRDITDNRIQAEISDPSLSVEDRLDYQTATIWITKLEQPFRIILEWSYGINGQSELSTAEIARTFETTPYFINKLRTQGIKELRRIMGL